MLNNSFYKRVDVLNDEGVVIISSVKINISASNRIILLGDKFAVLDRYCMVKVLGYMEDGIEIMEGQITLSIDSQVNIDIIRHHDKHERRSYLKVKINFNANIIRAYGKGRTDKSFNVKEVIESRDINAGGICFYSNKTFLIGQRLRIDLDAVKDGMIVEAMILRRKHESEYKNYRFRYACKFLNINNETVDAICAYVFRVEIDNHNKKLMREMKMHDE